MNSIIKLNTNGRQLVHNSLKNIQMICTRSSFLESLKLNIIVIKCLKNYVSNKNITKTTYSNFNRNREHWQKPIFVIRTHKVFLFALCNSHTVLTFSSLRIIPWVLLFPSCCLLARPAKISKIPLVWISFSELDC